MLKKRAKNAVLWSGADVFMSQGLQFFITIILARLLSPEEFGAVALLSIFIGVAGVFIDAGFSHALIQKQDVTTVDESTVFWFNMGMAILMMLILCAIAPLIAGYYELPILAPLTVALAINIIIRAMSSVQATLFTKRLDFKPLMKIGVMSTFLSGLVGVLMAWLGYGVWSLIGQTLTASVVTAILLWLLSPWRPVFAFSRRSAREFFKFGGYLSASWLLGNIYERGYALVIGKLFGLRELGLYSQADKIQQLPVGIISGVLARIAFPLFSATSNDLEKLRKGVKLSVRAIMLITTPAMLGLAVVASPFVTIIFGEQWKNAAPILSILCFAGILFPLHVINLNVLKAQGYSKLYFKLEIIKKVFGVILLIFGSFFGITGVAYSVVFSSIVSLFINAHYTGKYLKYGIIYQLADMLPSFASSIIMASVVLICGRFLEYSTNIELLMLIGIGITTYVGVSFFPGLNGWKEVLTYFRE